MPNLAAFHPQIVHFVIAGAGLGILFRWVSLSGKLKWTDGAARALIVIGAIAAWFAVTSGTQAHSVTERIPGAVLAVQLHEEEGHDTRNVLLALAALELIALVPLVAKWRRYLTMGAAALGVWGALELYDVGKAGGALVYSYAGGVGTRSGDTTDVNRLVMAAMYHRAALSRTEKNAAGAAQGFADLAAHFPNDPTVQILTVESLLEDRRDFAGAQAALARLPAPPDTSRLYARFQLARADAWLGLGRKDSARAILEALAAKFPASKRIQDRVEKAK